VTSKAQIRGVCFLFFLSTRVNAGLNGILSAKQSSGDDSAKFSDEKFSDSESESDQNDIDIDDETKAARQEAMDKTRSRH